MPAEFIDSYALKWTCANAVCVCGCSCMCAIWGDGEQQTPRHQVSQRETAEREWGRQLLLLVCIRGGPVVTVATKYLIKLEQVGASLWVNIHEG